MEAATLTPITEEFAREWGERFLGGWNSHDPDRLAGLATEDVVWEDPYIHGAGILHGREELRAWLRSVWRALPDLEFRVEDEPLLTADGTRLAVPWAGTAHMTGPLDPPGFAPTGGRIEMRGVDLHSFRGELVSHVYTVTDTAALARQVGAAPAPGSRGEKAAALVQRLGGRRLRSRNRGPQ